METDNILEKVQWDFNFENEFNSHRKAGFAFLIDVWQNMPNLVLYRIGPFNSYTNEIEVQPPQPMLVNALKQQDYHERKNDGLYYINDDIRAWIEKTLF
jgi:hypothetical protein